jgi:type I restriction enzyme M protein
LLLKVADEARAKVTLYGQEKDAATAGLARMNMILHDNPTAWIVQGNTLANPQFKDSGTLKTFEYVVANPPFSDKRWSNGVDRLNDPYDRFQSFGAPPDKQGDYAYLLHIVRSLKSHGKGACILPHGVLFRGNAEADIRRNLIRKNRLRAMDIHKIVDVFNNLREIPEYSRMVSFEEIERNEFNLNIPRYIDNRQAEDIQDIEGHLRGGIPMADVNAPLQRYWDVCPELRRTLFKENRPGYLDLTVDKQTIKFTIYEHAEFVRFTKSMNLLFADWRERNTALLKGLRAGFHPKQLIHDLAEDLLALYSGKPLIDKYDVYQHLMDYWTETMQDDCYLVAADGWKAETRRVLVKNKKGKEIDKGWICDLVPKSLIVARYFAAEQEEIEKIEAKLEIVVARMTEIEEEHGGEEGVFAELEKVNKATVSALLRDLRLENGELEAKDNEVLEQYLELCEQQYDLKNLLKTAQSNLDTLAYDKYPTLTEDEIKVLVVDDKWMAKLDADIHGAIDRVSQELAQRVRELAERYEMPIPLHAIRVYELEQRVNRHLERMGFSWK